MAYSESTWSSVGYRRRGGGRGDRHHHRDDVVTAKWPRGQAEAWFLLVIITAAVLIGVFASLMNVQQRMDLGVPWLFPYAISTGSITIFVIIILALFSKNNTLTPQLLIVLSFILFVLYVTGLIQTGIMLFGNGRIHANCQASVQNNPVRGATVQTLAWLEQNNICSCWYAGFSFWIVGMLCFIFLWVLSYQVASLN